MKILCIGRLNGRFVAQYPQIKVMVMKFASLCNAFVVVCCFSMICPADAAVESFGVDMYVKSPGPGHHIFRGTRTVSTYYPEAGWSVGEMRSGRLCFNIADGSNHSWVAQQIVDTSWREREWNHVAASFSDGKLSMWINGEKVPGSGIHLYEDRGRHRTNVCCVTSIASPRAVVTNGCDAMTGGRFLGQVEDYRYYTHALDDAEVSARAAKVAEMRASDPDTPKMVPDELGIDVEPPCALPNTPLTIQPVPQKAELSDENIPLEGPFAIVLPDENGLVNVAGEILQNSLARGCGVTATVVTVGTDLPAEGTHFTFIRDAKLGREEYRIEGAPANGGYKVNIYGTDRGYAYAADTLRQLIRIRSIENGRRLSLPMRMRIEDAPLMPHRVALSHWQATRDEALDFARARLNDMWVNSIKPGLTAEKLRQCCAMADACGVDVISGFGYRVTKPWTFSDPASMDEYKAHIDMLVECGVKGFFFMFDDLSGPSASAWSENPDMRKRFRSQGAFQNALVHQGIDWIFAHTNFSPSVMIACPSCYSRNWGERGKAYYPDFTKGFYERKVLTAHCVFGTDDVARLMADGSETYCYYLNGLWAQSRFFTWYTGPVSFRWSWYTWHVDLNGKGPVVNPEAMASIRSLHQRSKVFWAAASGGVANLQAGIISWNPPAYEPDLCDRATAQAYYGTGAYEQLRVFERALMPIIGYLGAYRTPFSMEWDLQVIPRHVGLSNKELAGYWRNYDAADAAFTALERAFKAQATPFDRPDLGDDRNAVLTEMRKTLDIVRKRLPSPIEGISKGEKQQ